MANLDKLISQVISHIYYNNERIIDANTLQDILIEIIKQLNEKKSDITYVDDELNKKADIIYVDAELAKKADTTYVNTELAKKADITYVNTELAKKADITYVDTELNKKANIDSPNLTGIPTAPTPQLDNNTTQIATTEYVIKQINTILSAAQALRYKGPIGANETLKGLPNNHTVGDTYIVSSAGIYAGQKCEVGDMVICRETGTTKNDKHWTIVQTNIDGAVIGPNTSINNNVAIFSGTTGKLIKNSGYTIEKSVPADAKFTDTVYILPQATTTTLGGVKVDNKISTTSTNPVQNKVITEKINTELAKKADTTYVNTELAKKWVYNEDTIKNVKVKNSENSDKLNNIEGNRYLYNYYRVYNNANNIIVKTNKKLLEQTMIQIHITGNSYIEGELPIDTTIQCYYYIPPTGEIFIRHIAINNGFELSGLKIFKDADGYFNLFIPKQNMHETFGIFITNGILNYNIIDSIREANIPNNALIVTDVEIHNNYNTRNFGSITNTEIDAIVK